MRTGILSGILILYLGISIAFAVRTPDWQSPDEPAHYNYIAQLVKDGSIPKMEAGVWDQAYLTQLTSSRFDPALLDNLDTVRYENHQPPLFYLLAAPVYLLTDGNLTALRIFSALFGLVIIVCAYGIGLMMYPDRPQIGLCAAALVAFLPQHVHILASVNNDSLGWALVALILLATVAYLKAYRVQPWQLGLLMGIGLITKSTTYFMAAVVLLAIVLHGWSDKKRLLRAMMMFLIPALVLGGAWWLRNISVYGFPDFLGLRAHDAVVIGQPRTAELIERVGFGGFLQEITRVSFHSFWGQFGWMAVPMPTWVYMAIEVFLAVAMVGWVINLRSKSGGDIAPPLQDNDVGAHLRVRPNTQNNLHVWIILLTTIILSVLAFLYYNTEFQQHQGRYMFPMLIPLGIVLALGIDSWRQIVTRFIPDNLKIYVSYLTVLVFMAFAILDIWLLWRVIVPNLAIS